MFSVFPEALLRTQINPIPIDYQRNVFTSNQLCKYIGLQCIKGFLGGPKGNESACTSGGPGSVPGSGRAPGEENGNPLQYSCLENSMDRGGWQAIVHGMTNSQIQLIYTASNVVMMTKKLFLGHFLIYKETNSLYFCFVFLFFQFIIIKKKKKRQTIRKNEPALLPLLQGNRVAEERKFTFLEALQLLTEERLLYHMMN